MGARGGFAEGFADGVVAGGVEEGLADYVFGGNGEEDGDVVDVVAVDWGEFF